MSLRSVFGCFFVLMQWVCTVPIGPIFNETEIYWLPNSNKLALGYNPAHGNPICYSGDCVMDGFGASVFELQYTKQPLGACFTKLIPEHVEVRSLLFFQLSLFLLDFWQKTGHLYPSIGSARKDRKDQHVF